MPEPATISIDPRVALQEERLRSQAIEAHYANRVLVLGQRVFDLERQIERLKAEAAENPPPAE